MFRGSTTHWNVFGVALMLTVALSNTSCYSNRPKVSTRTTETTAAVTATEHTESTNEEQHETIRTETTEGVTVTEIEVYDTTLPKDPETGLPPVKARIKQRHDQSGKSLTTEQTAITDTAKSDTDFEYEGGELGEVTVTATKEPGLWDRAKVAAQFTVAIMILAVAWCIIYKIKKRKTL